MKVIIISDVLDEPYELDSDRHEDNHGISFGYVVRDQVDAVLETEKIKAKTKHHGIFGSSS